MDELVAALATAQEGEVLFLDGAAEIDCTEMVYVEQLVLEVPGGVTLVSDRGTDGSEGALIVSDCLKTRPLFRTLGPNVRFSGLRIVGPNPKRCMEHHRRSFGPPPLHHGGRGHEYYYKFPVSDGIEAAHENLTIDNCELSGWRQAPSCRRKVQDITFTTIISITTNTMVWVMERVMIARFSN
uniref:hypothetical protein n=1 Tax=Cephaloticoccus sp. TaxID=1985742 RepID=UPI00404A15F0